jgi:hemolysin III
MKSAARRPSRLPEGQITVSMQNDGATASFAGPRRTKRTKPVNHMPRPLQHPVSRRIDRSILAAMLGFSLAAMAVLAYLAARAAGPRQAIAILVYAATLVGSALCSFVYHALPQARWRSALRYLDHAAIFLLIAGTYTPFAGDELRGPLGFTVLEWVWALALAGVVLKLLLLGAYDRTFVGLYLGIGWFILAAGRASIAAIALPSLVLLAFGGVVYTAGAIIYARDRGHWTAPAWHGCVLTGALAHFLAVVVSAITPTA